MSLIRSALLITAIVLASFFVAGEAIVRLSLPLLRAQSPAYYYRQYMEALVLPDERLVWKGKPGAEAVIENPLSRKVSYSLNSLGWRGPEISGGKKALVLGDSFTFGTGVEAGERYIEQLSVPGLSFYGAAVMGYGTDQHYLLAKEWLEKENWSVLLVQMSNNDLSDLRDHLWKGEGKLPDAIASKGQPFSGQSELLGLLGYFRQLVVKARPDPVALGDALVRLEQSLGAILELAGDKKIPVVILQATDWGAPVYGEEIAERYRVLVQGLAREHNAAFVEFQGSREDLLPFPDLHWTPEAHKKVADLLRPYL